MLAINLAVNGRTDMQQDTKAGHFVYVLVMRAKRTFTSERQQP